MSQNLLLIAAHVEATLAELVAALAATTDDRLKWYLEKAANLLTNADYYIRKGIEP